MTEKKKILVIDDDPEIQDYCRVVLESGGYAVHTASSGTEGRELAGRHGPHLVILDIMMEEADAGFQTAAWFAANHPDTPILMLSSIAEASEQVFDTSTLKVADLVDKPVAPKVLLEKVARLLARAKKD